MVIFAVFFFFFTVTWARFFLRSVRGSVCCLCENWRKHVTLPPLSHLYLFFNDCLSFFPLVSFNVAKQYLLLLSLLWLFFLLDVRMFSSIIVIVSVVVAVQELSAWGAWQIGRNAKGNVQVGVVVVVGGGGGGVVGVADSQGDGNGHNNHPHNDSHSLTRTPLTTTPLTFHDIRGRTSGERFFFAWHQRAAFLKAVSTKLQIVTPLSR
jgi:hypothetical protein